MFCYGKCTNSNVLVLCVSLLLLMTFQIFVRTIGWEASGPLAAPRPVFSELKIVKKTTSDNEEIQQEVLENDFERQLKEKVIEVEELKKRIKVLEALEEQHQDQLGAEREAFTQEQEVCPEKYLGIKHEQHFNYHFYDVWIRDSCSYEKDIGELVTVLVNFAAADRVQDKLDKLAKGLRDVYPTVKLLVAVNRTFEVKHSNVEILTVGSKNPTGNWKKLVDASKTKYVLVGLDLEYVTEWINLHRGVWLLGQGKVAVGGAVRNSSGHWRAPCYQVDIRYFKLEIEEGYAKAEQDCMICDYSGGPVLLTKERMKKLNTDVPESLMMMDLSLQEKGKWLTCPDIMYSTGSSLGRDVKEVGRDGWRSLARKWQIQGVVTDWRPRFQEKFSCDEIGIKCDAWKSSANFQLLPWCCVDAWRHLFKSFEYLAEHHGLQYEMNCGTALGAVKMGGFMPWDIDADCDFRSDQIDSFKIGGVGEAYLKENGIKYDGAVRIDKHNPDSCNHVFTPIYKNIHIDMCGMLHKNLSLDHSPEMIRNAPTRVEVGPDMWFRTFSNPGLYSRGWYGPGYLFHSVSYIYKGLSAFDHVKPGPWKKCKTPGKHYCLDRYPVVGNMGLLPGVYP